MRRPCLDCGVLIGHLDGSHCGTCKARIERRLQAKRNAQFGGSGGRWQTLRKQAFERQEGRCARCGNELGTSFEVDHVVPRSAGGGSAPENLQALHRECHQAVTRARAKR